MKPVKFGIVSKESPRRPLRLTNLGLWHHGVMSVAQRRKLKSSLLLYVTLLEELFHTP